MCCQTKRTLGPARHAKFPRTHTITNEPCQELVDVSLSLTWSFVALLAVARCSRLTSNAGVVIVARKD